MHPIKRGDTFLRSSTPTAAKSAKQSAEDASSDSHNDPHHVWHTHDEVHVHQRPHWTLFNVIQRLHLSRSEGAGNAVGSGGKNDSEQASRQDPDNQTCLACRNNGFDIASEDFGESLPCANHAHHVAERPLSQLPSLDAPLHPVHKHHNKISHHWSIVDLFLKPRKEHHSQESDVGPNAPPPEQVQFDTPSYPPPDFEVPSAQAKNESVNYQTTAMSFTDEDEAIGRIEAESFQKLKQYKFIKVIGAGAQGTVSLRLHSPTSSLRALKSIPTSGSPVDSHVVESFRREVQILQECRKHPNVIRLLEAWESQYTVYQAFDVMNGGDASMEGAFDAVREPESARLIAPIADALRYLHSKSIIHRDTRPANIFLRRAITGHESLRELETIPVLADFGIANYTRNSGRLGAPFPEIPAHIAPEILDGARFTTASDAYGLGYYALHMLLRRPPCVADVRKPMDIDHPDAIVWKEMSVLGKETVAALLKSDPFDRMSAQGFCTSAWVVEMGVECVKHPLLD
ncbi:hypothetical protein HDU77_005326 [Chytriomyces hyalinus]|nr:hypothetical protein HDU77_005326 [Chytriomyces hyalinus]